MRWKNEVQDRADSISEVVAPNIKAALKVSISMILFDNLFYLDCGFLVPRGVVKLRAPASAPASAAKFSLLLLSFGPAPNSLCISFGCWKCFDQQSPGVAGDV